MMQHEEGAFCPPPFVFATAVHFEGAAAVVPVDAAVFSAVALLVAAAAAAFVGSSVAIVVAASLLV